MNIIKAEYANSAEKIMGCRCCLATDVKLLNIYENRLADVYVELTGISVLAEDGFPQHLCSYCRGLLLKYAAFRNRCLRAQAVLQTEMGHHQITTEYISTIDRFAHRLMLNLKTEETKIVDTTDFKENLIEEIKKETSDIELENIFIDPEELKMECDLKDKSLNDTVDDFSDDNLEHIFVATKPAKKEKKMRKIRRRLKKESHKKIRRRLPNNDFLPDFDIVTFENSYCVEIVTLTKEQQLEEIEARKKSSNYHYAAYKCDHCGKGFRAEPAFRNHMIRHSPSMGPHPCEICGVRFRQQCRRQEHQDLHRLKLICKKCEFVSRTRYQAKKHFEFHTGKTHICKHCGASFPKSSTYLSHVRLQHPAKNVACDECGESFVGRLGLLQHQSRAHQKNPNNQRDLTCAVCEVLFDTPEALDRHTDISNNACSDMRPCKQCGETFPNEESLQSHKQENHNEDQFKCLECNKTFSSQSSFDIHHQRVHLNVRWRKKSERAAAGARGERAPRHGAPGAPGAPRKREAVCETCGKTCDSNAALVYHQRQHTGERPYKCTQCPKSFTMPQALMTHQLVHSDERPFMCSACPKTFKAKVSLQLHSRVHTGERPYKCSLCDSSFKQGPHLKTHIKLMHHMQEKRRPKTSAL